MSQYRKDLEASKSVDDFLTNTYYGIFQITLVYPKMEGRNRILSILQIMMYIVALVFNMVLLTRCTAINYGFNMVLFSQNVHYCLLMQLSLIAMINWLWKNFQLFLIFRYIASDFYDYQEPPVIGEELLRAKMNTERRLLTLLPIGVVLCAGIVLTISPVIDFQIGDFDFDKSAELFDYHFPYPYGKYPFNAEDGFGYYIALAGQLASGFILAVVVGGGGFLFIQLAENIILQLKILNSSLDNMESRIEHMHSKLFGKMDQNVSTSLQHDSHYAYCYTKCLRKNFEHHQIILKAFNLLEDIFSLPIAGSYITGAIVIALSLISAGSMKELPGTSMASLILCVTEVGYMFLFSSLGQRFTDLSTELRYKMYNTKWYLYSKEIKSSLMIFQEMTLKPMTLTVGKMVPANMETFSTVMKSAYSYYNLVNAFGSN